MLCMSRKPEERPIASEAVRCNEEMKKASISCVQFRYGSTEHAIISFMCWGVYIFDLWRFNTLNLFARFMYIICIS